MTGMWCGLENDSLLVIFALWGSLKLLFIWCPCWTMDNILSWSMDRIPAIQVGWLWTSGHTAQSVAVLQFLYIMAKVSVNISHLNPTICSRMSRLSCICRTFNLWSCFLHISFFSKTSVFISIELHSREKYTYVVHHSCKIQSYSTCRIDPYKQEL